MLLYLGIDETGLELGAMQPQFTVMTKGLATADPRANGNMVCVSNSSVLDPNLTSQPGKMVVHAYGTGNEDYGSWAKSTGGS